MEDFTRLYSIKTIYECGKFSLCKKPSLIAECCALQDIQFLFTLKRASAVEKTRMLPFTVSVFLCKYSQFCVKMPGLIPLVLALHCQLCWSTPQINSRFRQCVTVKLHHWLCCWRYLGFPDTKGVSFLMIQGSNHQSPWEILWMICTPDTQSPSHMVKQGWEWGWEATKEVSI